MRSFVSAHACAHTSHLMQTQSKERSALLRNFNRRLLASGSGNHRMDQKKLQEVRHVGGGLVQPQKDPKKGRSIGDAAFRSLGLAILWGALRIACPSLVRDPKRRTRPRPSRCPSKLVSRRTRRSRSSRRRSRRNPVTVVPLQVVGPGDQFSNEGVGFLICSLPQCAALRGGIRVTSWRTGDILEILMSVMFSQYSLSLFTCE